MIAHGQKRKISSVSMPLKRKQELQSKSVEGIRTSEFGGRREVQT